MRINVNARYCKEQIDLVFNKYQNGEVAIQGFSLEGEPVFTATVSLQEKPKDGYVFLKGWSENEGIPDALEKAGIVKLTGRTVRAGFAEAQEAELLEL